MASKTDADLKRAFGEAVREFRTARGLSQERLAELAGIHRTYLGDVERGTRNIALVNMHRISAALGIPLSALTARMEE